MKKVIMLMVLVVLVLSSTAAFAGVSKVEIVIENRERVDTVINENHRYVMGYAEVALGPTFLRNDWDRWDVGEPDFGNLALEEKDYLDTIRYLSAETWYYIDLSARTVQTHEFLPYSIEEVTGTEEYYTYEEPDPLTILITHTIITYVTTTNVTYTLVSQVYDGTEPDITVTPLDVNFGDVPAGSSVDRVVTVGNEGNADLTVGQVTTPGAPFSIVQDNVSNRTLAPGAEATLTVRFAPGAAGLHNDSFDIPSNDPDENPVTVSLSGTTDPAPAVTGTDPVDGAKGVAVNTNIVITFNKSVRESVYFNDIAISGGGSVVAYVYGLNAGTLTLDPTGSLNYSTRYTVTIPAGAVEDSDGNLLAAGHTFSFTTRSRPSSGDDTAALVIGKTNPPDGTAGTAYTHTFTASGGSTPYTFKITGGTLPEGLSLAPDGTLSGTPVTPSPTRSKKAL